MRETKNARSSSLLVLRLLAPGCSPRDWPRGGWTYVAFLAQDAPRQVFWAARKSAFGAGGVDLSSARRLSRSGPRRRNRSPQTAGSKNSVSAVDVISPPITTVASGL